MRYRRFVEYDALVLTASIWFLAKFLRYAFPPLFDPLQASYGVTNADLGLAFTGFMVVYALMQFPSGVLADRFGTVRVIAAGAAVAAAAALVLAVDSPYPVLVAAMLAMGAGTGAHKTVAVRLLSRAYPTRTGRALGALDTFGAFGGVVAPAAIVAFLSAPPALAVLLARLPGAGWRGLFLASGLVGLSVAAAFRLRVPKRLPGGGAPEDSATGPSPGARDYLALFGSRRLTVFVLAMTAFGFGYNGAVAFLPLYLSQEAGMSTTAASLLYSVLFVMTFVQLVTGDLSDRVGRLPVMVAAIGLAALALVGVVAVADAGAPTLGVLVVALGLGAHGYRPVRGAYLVELLPDWLAGGGLGAVRTLLMSAGAFAPGVVGVVADAFGFRVAFALLAAAMTFAAVVAAGLWVLEE